MKTITVAAIDDHAVALAGLERILADVSDINLAAKYATVDELLADPTRPDIDVVLLDLRLQDGSDPYINVEKLRKKGYEVLIFSSLESPFLLRRAMYAGTNGVLDKTVKPQVLTEAIRACARGDSIASAEWAGVIDTDERFREVHLSERQREVLELYAMGESARRVAQITGLSQETVQDYIGRIRTKYAVAGRDASNKVSLFRRAQEDGYIPGPWEC